MTHRSIRIPWESWLHLRKIMNKQISPDRPLSEDSIRRMKQRFDNCFSSGVRDMCDGDLGGMESGRYTYWTVDQMAAMLDEAGLPYTWSTCERMTP